MPGTRRRRLIEITAGGRAVAAAFLPVVHAAERPWPACLNTAEQRMLLHFLGRIRRQLTGSQNDVGSPRRATGMP
jgi:hypothetical protein